MPRMILGSSFSLKNCRQVPCSSGCFARYSCNSVSAWRCMVRNFQTLNFVPLFALPLLPEESGPGLANLIHKAQTAISGTLDRKMGIPRQVIYGSLQDAIRRQQEILFHLQAQHPPKSRNLTHWLCSPSKPGKMITDENCSR